MKVSILCTDPEHPVTPWLMRWQKERSGEHEITMANRAVDLIGGDILFLISCTQIIGASIRSRFRHSLVLHASDLPEGRGMSPHVWQIVEGRDEITLSLIDAEDEVDTGRIWAQRRITLEGHELYDEINARLFAAEIELMTWAVDNIDTSAPREQQGTPSRYRARTPADSRLDPEATIAAQFDLLRVADPNRFPAFFDYRGCRYKLRIEKIT